MIGRLLGDANLETTARCAHLAHAIPALPVLATSGRLVEPLPRGNSTTSKSTGTPAAMTATGRPVAFGGLVMNLSETRRDQGWLAVKRFRVPVRFRNC